jgi:hypothetical protein
MFPTWNGIDESGGGENTNQLNDLKANQNDTNH